MDSFSLNDEEKAQYVGLPQTVVDVGLNECKNSFFAIIYGGGLIYAQGFRIAMSRAWKCQAESFKMHSLKDSVFHIISHTYSGN